MNKKKEVIYAGKCEVCKHDDDKLENILICDDCLSHPYNTDSHTPIRFELKGGMKR